MFLCVLKTGAFAFFSQVGQSLASIMNQLPQELGALTTT